jgi:hypothetical protein
MRNVGTVHFPSARSLPAPYLLSADLPGLRSAGFQTCRIADFQVGSSALWPAGLETRDTADLEVCATLNCYPAPTGARRIGGGDGQNPPNPPLVTFTNEGK